MNNIKLTQYQAANKIQSLTRRHLARKRVNQIKNNAATKIQSLVRGHLARKIADNPANNRKITTEQRLRSYGEPLCTGSKQLCKRINESAKPLTDRLNRTVNHSINSIKRYICGYNQYVATLRYNPDETYLDQINALDDLRLLSSALLNGCFGNPISERIATEITSRLNGYFELNGQIDDETQRNIAQAIKGEIFETPIHQNAAIQIAQTLQLFTDSNAQKDISRAILNSRFGIAGNFGVNGGYSNIIPANISIHIARNLGVFTDPQAQSNIATAISLGRFGTINNPIPEDVTEVIGHNLSIFTHDNAIKYIAEAIRYGKFGTPIPDPLIGFISDNLAVFNEVCNNNIPEEIRTKIREYQETLELELNLQKELEEAGFDYFKQNHTQINKMLINLICEYKKDTTPPETKYILLQKLMQYGLLIENHLPERLKTNLATVFVSLASPGGTPTIENFYIIVPFNNNSYAVIEEPNLTELMIRNPELNKFSRVLILKEVNNGFKVSENREINETELDSIYSQIPSLKLKYSNAKKKLELGKIIELIEPNEFPELRDHLQRAFTELRMQNFSLVDVENQEKLKSVFNGFFEINDNSPVQNVEITKEHLSNIWNKFEISDKSDDEKSKHLLILGAIFTKLSSSTMFGTEGDSPYILREYAGALINSGFLLLNQNPDLTEDVKDEWQLTQEMWIGRLFGLRKPDGTEYFDCTDILSAIMKDKLKIEAPNLMAKLFPAVW